MYYDERKEVVAEAQTPAPDLEQRLLYATEPWRQHLLAAAEYLRTHGWCQHTGGIQERRCLQAAIAHEVGLIGVGPPQAAHIAFNAAHDKIAQYLGVPQAATHIWNDQPGRTVEQVIAALEGAARS